MLVFNSINLIKHPHNCLIYMELKVAYLLLVILQVFSLQAVPLPPSFRFVLSCYSSIRLCFVFFFLARRRKKYLFKNLRPVSLLCVLNRIGNYLNGSLIR